MGSKDLAQQVQDLPPELYNHILYEVFTPSDDVHIIDKHYKPPKFLAINHATRDIYSKLYYGGHNSEFVVNMSRAGQNMLLFLWLKSFPIHHSELLRHFKVVVHVKLKVPVVPRCTTIRPYFRIIHSPDWMSEAKNLLVIYQQKAVPSITCRAISSVSANSIHNKLPILQQTARNSSKHIIYKSVMAGNLIDRVHALPPELFNRIHDYVFTIELPEKAADGFRYQQVTKTFKYPKVLHINQANRYTLAKEYFEETIFVFKTNYLFRKFVSAMTKRHLLLVPGFRIFNPPGHQITDTKWEREFFGRSGVQRRILGVHAAVLALRGERLGYNRQDAFVLAIVKNGEQFCQKLIKRT